MKIAICDDREDDRGALKALLEAYGRDFRIKEYGSGKSLCGDMDYIRECGIVFLDINMDGMDGLETARQIKAECPKVHIVLVTAYVNYALDGYKVKASRFLVKDDLAQTLPECMDDILREIREEERVVEFGFVEGNVRLKVDDIIYIETSKHKNVFYTKAQTFSIYKKMDELEEDLKGMGFVRIHQSFLRNTGNETHITDKSQIENMIDNLNSVEMNRGKLSVGYSGYSFKITIYLSNGNVARGWNNFIINSSHLIRKDPFFYTVVDGNIDYDYIDSIVN